MELQESHILRGGHPSDEDLPLGDVNFKTGKSFEVEEVKLEISKTLII